jgi:hypothetical protein
MSLDPMIDKQGVSCLKIQRFIHGITDVKEGVVHLLEDRFGRRQPLRVVLSLEFDHLVHVP